MRDRGFLFTRSTKLQGIVPDWYQTAYHSPEFARALVGAHFEVTGYIPGGLGYQDVLLARR